MARNRSWVSSLPMAAIIFGLWGLWPGASRTEAGEGFLRGDVDGSLRLEITDAIRIFQFLFLGGAGGVSCQDAADVDDSGAIELTDGVYLLSFLFRQGSPPPAPFPACGADPTQDALGCAAHEGCEFSFTFYGQTFSADGVFFVVDRSASVANTGGLTFAKGEILRSLEEFSERARFGIVFFAAEVLKFPSSGVPAEATQEMKDSAASWVQSIPGGAGTCVQKGFAAALSFLDASTSKNNVMIYVSDGGGTCGPDEATYLKQTLDLVTERNQGRAKIHTFGVPDLSPLGEKFLQDLAAKNGGTYTRIIQ